MTSELLTHCQSLQQPTGHRVLPNVRQRVPSATLGLLAMSLDPKPIELLHMLWGCRSHRCRGRVSYPNYSCAAQTLTWELSEMWILIQRGRAGQGRGGVV